MNGGSESGADALARRFRMEPFLDYLAYERGLSARTLEAYGRDLRRFVAFVRDLGVTAPEYLVVPTGSWHTMDVIEPGRAVIITWGEGTQHRPR